MAYYLKYTIKNLEPLRISDDSISEQGQTSCLTYIPGSAIRGVIVSKLAKDADFEKGLKEKLFLEDTAFLNAYLSVGNLALLPSPKGFYEDKRIVDGKKEIQNVVVDGVFDEGMKRAGLGNVSELDFESCLIKYFSVKQNSELKIKLGEEKNMYRNAFLEEGQMFVGAIKSSDKSILERMEKILNKDVVIIGNARSSGYGKCEIKTQQIDEVDNYQNYKVTSEFKNFAYLYLLSDVVMRDAKGEYCGLDLEKLQRNLGVNNLKVEFCSTSTRDVRGYNRTLGIRLPSVMMYEKGSVFKITFDGTIKTDKASAVMDNGIGERRNEGFGRVLLFNSSYEKLQNKIAGQITEKIPDGEPMPEDNLVLMQIAKNYYKKKIDVAARKYVVDQSRNRGGISQSKARAIEPILVSNRFDAVKAHEVLDEYYSHESNKQEAKKRQKVSGDIQKSKDHVVDVLDTKLENLLNIQTKEPGKVMGISASELLTDEEAGRLKLEIILSELRYDSKGEK